MRQETGDHSDMSIAPTSAPGSEAIGTARARRARADAELFARYCATRSPELREELVVRFMPLAQHIARNYMREVDREDVAQVASLALLKAIDRYDPARGTTFSTYATPTIVGEIKRYFRDLGWPVRVPRSLQERALQVFRASAELTSRIGRSPTPSELADELGIDVEQVLEALATATALHPDRLDRSTDDEEEGPVLAVACEDAGYELAEDAATLAPLLGGLSERERVMLHLRFQEDMTQSEIGDMLGVSQMQVSRLLRHAIAQLQKAAGRGEPPPG